MCRVLVMAALCLTSIFFETPPVHAMRQPAAVRLLRISSGVAAGEAGIDSQPVFAPRPARDKQAPWTLFFTREVNGTRNLWRAQAEARDDSAPIAADESSPDAFENDSARLSGRSVAWRATPLTRLAAPFFAENAVATPDGRQLICVSNALEGTPLNGSQIARLDLNSGRLTPLVSSNARNYAPALSPGGSHLAFVSNRSGTEAIYVMPLDGGTPRRVAALARQPVWLDEATLIFQSTRPGQSGLYRLGLPRPGDADARWNNLRPRLLFARGGKAAVTPDGQQLCVAAEPSHDGEAAQLYVLAADGSGAHVVPETAGARQPCFAPDGASILFDAPADGADAASNRALWILPMLRVAPTAMLLGVNAVDRAGEIEIKATAFAEGSDAPEVKLECGQGAQPTRWTALPVTRGPLYATTLATWKPAPGARGDWTLRLTVTDAAGDQAQSTLLVSLPLNLAGTPGSALAARLPEDLLLPSASSSGAQAPSSGAQAPSSGAQPPSIAVLPGTPATNAQGTTSGPAPPPSTRPGRGTPRASNQGSNQSKRDAARGGAVPMLPLSSLPLPAPPVNSATPAGSLSPEAMLSGAIQSTGAPAVDEGAAPDAQGAAPDSTGELMSPDSASPDAASIDSGPPDAATLGEDERDVGHKVRSVLKREPRRPEQARLSVRGTPAAMKADERVEVVVTMRNVGTRSWLLSDDKPVRLTYRWVDAETGTRSRWRFQWLRGNVAPGGQTRLTLAVTAPPRAGRFKLIYALVRISEGFQPPAASLAKAQLRWPGEFSSRLFNVVVR